LGALAQAKHRRLKDGFKSKATAGKVLGRARPATNSK
jgi:hypothetical protein